MIRRAAGCQELCRLAYLSKQIELVWPCNFDTIEGRPREFKLEGLGRWVEHGSQVVGVGWFINKPYANCWLQYPSALRPCKYIDALTLYMKLCNEVCDGRAQPESLSYNVDTALWPRLSSMPSESSRAASCRGSSATISLWGYRRDV